VQCDSEEIIAMNSPAVAVHHCVERLCQLIKARWVIIGKYKFNIKLKVNYCLKAECMPKSQ